MTAMDEESESECHLRSINPNLPTMHKSPRRVKLGNTAELVFQLQLVRLVPEIR